MIVLTPGGDETLYESEQRFVDLLDGKPGILVVNADLSDRRQYNTSREFDGILITPTGVFTVEVKGTSATGDFRAPNIDRWSVGGDKEAFKGRPGRQASRQSKILAGILERNHLRVGYVNAVVAVVPFGGPVVLPKGKPAHFVEKVHVLIADENVYETIDAHVHGETPRGRISIETALKVLDRLGGSESAPDREELAKHGFRTEAEIAAHRAFEHEQLTAAARDLDALTPARRPKNVPAQAIEDRPAADVARWQASLSQDPDLTEVGHIHDGVAFSRDAFAKLTSMRVSQVTLADVVKNPESTVAGTNGKVTYHVGQNLVATVRVLDGLVVGFDHRVDFERRRDGACIDGWRITANVVRRANFYGIPLEALVRVADQHEDEWSDTKQNLWRARCDFAVLCQPADKTILGVDTRIAAMALAFDRASGASEPSNPTEWITEATVDGVLIRSSAYERIKKKVLSAATVVSIYNNPEATWPGFSSGPGRSTTEVRLGPNLAIIVDTRDGAVVATTSRQSAIQYRDGVTVDGVKISGRALHAASLRGILPVEIAETVHNARTRYGRPGRQEVVYRGRRFGVVRGDDGVVIGTIPLGEIERNLIQNEYVKVEQARPAPEPTTTTPPNPSTPRNGQQRQGQQRQSRGPATKKPGPSQQQAREIVPGIRIRSKVSKMIARYGVDDIVLQMLLEPGASGVQVESFTDEKGSGTRYTRSAYSCTVRDGHVTGARGPIQPVTQQAVAEPTRPNAEGETASA